jgi:ribosomal protein L16 Arg81 hydroxylase
MNNETLDYIYYNANDIEENIIHYLESGETITKNELLQSIEDDINASIYENKNKFTFEGNLIATALKNVNTRDVATNITFHLSARGYHL